MGDAGDALFQEELADLAASGSFVRETDKPVHSVFDDCDDLWENELVDLADGEAASASFGRESDNPMGSFGDNFDDVFEQDLAVCAAGDTASASSATELPVRSFVKRPGQGKGKGGGRPRGSSFVWQLAAQNAEEAEDDSDAPAAPGSIEYARECRRQKLQQRANQLSSQQAAMTAFGRFEDIAGIGTKLQQRLREAAQNMIGKEQQPDEFLQRQFETPSATMSFKQMDTFVQSTCSHVRVLAVAAAMLRVGGFLWGILMTCLCCFFTASNGSGSSVAQPVAMIVKMRYDETPTKVRLVDIMPQEPASSHSIVPQGQTKSPHAKVVQSELSLAFLVRMTGGGGSKKGEFKLLHGSVPTCLTAVDRCTAENLRATVLGHMDCIPELRGVAQQFPVRVRHTCCDRFAGNLSAEKALDQDFRDWLPMLLTCDVHKLYNCTEGAPWISNGIRVCVESCFFSGLGA